jgi:hypothetical protein
LSENGKLPKSQLSRIYHPNHKVYLEKEAAAGFNTLRIWSKKWMNIDLYPTGPRSAYRSYEEQLYFWNLYQSGKGNLAAYPGTSNHGWGKAIDLAGWSMKTILDKFGSKVGWKKTEAFEEWWHYNYVGGFKRPNPGTNARYPTARKGSGGFGQRWYVKKLERKLRKLGYKVKVDGEFGSLTNKSVKDFQKNKGLKPDGIVGLKTWVALESSNPKSYKQRFGEK